MSNNRLTVEEIEKAREALRNIGCNWDGWYYRIEHQCIIDIIKEHPRFERLAEYCDRVKPQKNEVGKIGSIRFISIIPYKEEEINGKKLIKKYSSVNKASQ